MIEALIFGGGFGTGCLVGIGATIWALTTALTGGSGRLFK